MSPPVTYRPAYIGLFAALVLAVTCNAYLDIYHGTFGVEVLIWSMVYFFTLRVAWKQSGKVDEVGRRRQKVWAIVAVLATLLWCWLIATSVRSPMRGIMHWMAGLTLFWLLIVTLWMPWIDYGKTYRHASAALARALPEKRDCIAGVNLSDAIVASLDYFDGIRTVAASPSDHRKCELLLIHGTANESGVSVAGGWRQIWEGGRPAERRESEKLHLYRRELKKSAIPGK